MRDQLEAKLARFEELERDLIDPAVMAQPQRLAAVAREHGSLARLARRYRGFVDLERQIADLATLPFIWVHVGAQLGWAAARRFLQAVAVRTARPVGPTRAAQLRSRAVRRRRREDRRELRAALPQPCPRAACPRRSRACAARAGRARHTAHRRLRERAACRRRRVRVGHLEGGEPDRLLQRTSPPSPSRRIARRTLSPFSDRPPSPRLSSAHLA